MAGQGGGVAGQEAQGLPALDPELRARHVRKFMGFVERKAGRGRLATQPALVALVALVERLVGNAPALFQDMALVKPAQGRKKRWHQDHAFFNVALDTPTVGVWIPMGAVTPENGCMHLLAGGHKAGARILFKRRDFCLRAWPTPLSTASVT